MRLFSVLLSAAVLAACTVRVPVEGAALSADPAVAGGIFNTGGGVSLAADVKNIGGKTGICGIWAESDNQSVLTKGISDRVLRPSAVLLGNEALVTGLQFLKKVDPAKSYAGTHANCVVIERPWSAVDAAKPVRILMPRQVIDRDDDANGAFVVRFRPSGPSAHPDDPKPWQRG